MFEQMDNMRRQRGQWLDSAGFAPTESPFRIIHRQAGVQLRRYAGTSSAGPAMLIVPAPFKRAYIWDLTPEASVVRLCMQHGMQVYLAEWTQVNDATDIGLADYGGRLLAACAEAIAADCGEKRIILAGHSLGGVLAAIFSCLFPVQVRATVLLEAPLHFGIDAGNFAPLVAATPNAQSIGDAFGNVPGTFLNMVSAVAAPHAFQLERYIDCALSAVDYDAMRIHMCVERWAHDEFSMPGKLFNDIVERLYRNDEFMRGALRLDGRHIGPEDLKAPLLNVVDPRSTVIPPQSILPCHEAAASKMKKVLQYEGDIGVGLQHVGVLVGANARRLIWPAIFEWLQQIRTAD